MVYAYSTRTAKLDKHEGYGYFAIEITTNGDVLEKPALPFYLIHGWLMWVTWGLLGLLQLASNRYLKPFWQVNKLFHALSGSAMLILTFVFGILAIKNLGWHMVFDFHNLMGLAVIFVVGFIVLGGFAITYMQLNIEWRTVLMLKAKLVH